MIPRMNLWVLCLSLMSSTLFALPKLNFKVPNPERESATIPPEELKNVGIDEKLGQTIDFSGLDFLDEHGETVNLGQYFEAGKPVILALAYYNCNSICNLLLNGLSSAAQNQKWTIGKEYKVVNVSFDANDTPDSAMMKKTDFVKEYGRLGAENGWHWLTGKEDVIHNLTSQVGFRYKFIESTGQFAHNSALIMLTPEGKVSRYLHGIQYSPTDFKLALIEAGEGKVGNFVDKALMFCFQYDPDRKGYAFVAFKLVQWGSILTAIFLFLYLFWFWAFRSKKLDASKRQDGQDGTPVSQSL